MVAIDEDIRHLDTWDMIAEIFQPRERVRASEWAEAERQLQEGTTPQPGPWRNDYVPWIEQGLNQFFDEPAKRGIITMKPAQGCWSDIEVTRCGYLFDHLPGPTMFLFTTDNQARKFGLERFDYMIDQSPALLERFSLGKSNHETMHYKESLGGPLILAGSGSVNNFISNPYRWIFVDEYDDIGEIPRHGDPFDLLEKRQGEWDTRQRCGLFVWAHPTRPDVGIAKIYADLSDQREWTIDCPLCHASFVPSWDHVVIDDRDPETARYFCPHCDEELSDPKRWAACRRGRFESQLVPEVARKREFIGYHFSKLCHHRIALRTLARQYCNCHTEQQLKVFYNKVLGLPYMPSSVVLTEAMVRAKVDDRHVNTSCPSDTLFITAGVDVQKPKQNPTLYYVIEAWTRRGTAVVLEYGRVRGWRVLHHKLASFESRRSRSKESLRIAGCGIDYGYETRQVYTFCQQNHGGVPCVPFKHTPGVREDDPTRVKAAFDPLQPELGSIKRVETHRTYWMDRVLGRFSPVEDETIGGGVILPANVDREFVNHVLANVRIEAEDEHGHPKAVYVKDEVQRDDWLQAMVGAEVMAVAKGLDRVHNVAAEGDRSAQREVAEGLVTSETRVRQRQPGSRRYRSRHRGGRRFW